MNAYKAYVLCVAICSMACDQKVEHQTVEVVRPVKMIEVSAGSLKEPLEYPGTVAASQQSELSFVSQGQVIELKVKEGQSVKKGQVLAKLDSTEARAQLQSVNARLRADKAEYERYKQLYATQAASLADLDVKRKAYEVSVASAVKARKDVADTRIVAPFDGKISRRFVEQYQSVQAKEPVILLQDLKQLEVKVNIAESDWSRVRPVLTNPEYLEKAGVRIEITSLPGVSYKGAIKEVATAANPQTRTFSVRIGFLGDVNKDVLPGMTAKVVGDAPSNIVESEEISLPARAIVGGLKDAKPKVWVVDQESMTVSTHPVVLGSASEDRIVIESGLEAGQKIAISGVQQLREGMKVSEFSMKDLRK